MNARDRLTFFQTLDQTVARAETELVFHNPYTLLVAVVLSAQATDDSVNKATKTLFAHIRTPHDMVTLGEDALKTHIHTIGLYPTKARHLMALSHLLIEKHEGVVPSSFEALCALPGVGRKTANVVLNIAFHQPTIPVDTHVFRVANRTGLATGKTPLEVEEKLLRVTPKAFLPSAHHLLILHGRYVCKARKPLCAVCVVRDVCAFGQRQAKTTSHVEV
ncbi:endonuclease III [Candidatus Hepatobacter penaei]|uniref:endonuclease III n=1 Tax=Candidatus Hepatobacter penaei TaxID=1274402 RepID=UPI0004F33BEA|nr:endonuclease III [Candidatus Hepatobacter penaei]